MADRSPGRCGAARRSRASRARAGSWPALGIVLLYVAAAGASGPGQLQPGSGPLPPSTVSGGSVGPSQSSVGGGAAASGGGGGGCVLRFLTVQQLGGVPAGTEERQVHSSPDEAAPSLTSAAAVLSFLTSFSGTVGDLADSGGSEASAELRNPSMVPMGSVQRHFFSSWTGRPPSDSAVDQGVAVFGAPGGDLGEFILALAAVEKTRGEQADLTDGEIRDLLDKWLGIREEFYVQTDKSSHDAWSQMLGFDPLAPESFSQNSKNPDAHIVRLQNALDSAPDYLGDEHLRLMMQEHESYGVRLHLVQQTIRSVFSVLFHPRGPDSRKIKVALSRGEAGREEAFIDVLSPDPVEAPACQYLAPMVVPNIGPHSAMVYHPRAVYEERGHLATFMAAKLGRDLAYRNKLFSDMAVLGNAAMEKTKSRVIPGRPTFVARFSTTPGGGSKSPSTTASNTASSTTDAQASSLSASPATMDLTGR